MEWKKTGCMRLVKKAALPVLFLLVIPVWGAAQILNTPVICVYRFGIYGICFLLGYYVFSHEKVTDRLARVSVPLAAAAVVLAVFMCGIISEKIMQRSRW